MLRLRRRLLSAVSVGVVSSNPAVIVFMCGLRMSLGVLRKLWVANSLALIKKLINRMSLRSLNLT